MRRLAPVALACAIAMLLGCGGGEPSSRVRVVASTQILADLARNVAGDRADVSSLVPAGGDPHSYEPTTSDVRRVAEADVTFTNHLLLEEHALIKTIDANAPDDAPNVSLAEASEGYGARVIALVDDVGLDVLWLGVRVRGDGGAARSSDVVLEVTGHDGPGRFAAYRTDALGEPERLAHSGDGLDARDRLVLPPAAHTHLTWAFTAPGVHRLAVRASLRTEGGARPVGRATFTFAVGVDPVTAGGGIALDGGHADLTIDLGRNAIYALAGDRRIERPVLVVPETARERVPADRRFGFLGRAGDHVFQLPQAVLGKHVHGEIDPHLWQDVGNAIAYVQLIRDTLARVDPEGADVYRANTDTYLRRLRALDEELRREVGAIPEERRRLVTTHDAFAYLADAYGLEVAGFVVPNPAQEPSAEQVRALAESVTRQRVPAVFVEPSLSARAAVLRQIAADHGVRVCRLYGDAFDEDAEDYVTMMRHNGRELRRCLG